VAAIEESIVIHDMLAEGLTDNSWTKEIKGSPSKKLLDQSMWK